MLNQAHTNTSGHPASQSTFESSSPCLSDFSSTTRTSDVNVPQNPELGLPSSHHVLFPELLIFSHASVTGRLDAPDPPPAASRLCFPSGQSLPTSLGSCSSCPNRVDWHLPRVVSQAPQTQHNQERPDQLTPRVSQVPGPPLSRWLSQNLRVTLVSSPWKVVKLPQPVAKSLGSVSEYPSICPLFSILTVTVLDTTTSIPHQHPSSLVVLPPASLPLIHASLHSQEAIPKTYT